MSRVRVHNFSVSLDGCREPVCAGPPVRGPTLLTTTHRRQQASGPLTEGLVAWRPTINCAHGRADIVIADLDRPTARRSPGPP